MSQIEKKKLNLLKFQQELNQQFLEIFEQKNQEGIFSQNSTDFLGLLVHVDNLSLFLPLLKLKTISLKNEYESIVRTKSWLLGFNQERGEVYTIFNLHKVLNLVLHDKTDFEKVQVDNESRIIYVQDIDQNKAAFLLNDVKLDYTAEFTSLIKFNKEINDIYWKVNEGIELDLFIKEENMSELEWSILNEMRKNILLEERLSEDNFDNISGMSLLASFMENVYLDAMGEKQIFVLNLDRLVKYLNTKIPF